MNVFRLLPLVVVAACDVQERPIVDAPDLFERGIERFNAGALDQAEQHLKQAYAAFMASKNSSSAARAMEYLGRINLAQGRFRQSLGDFQTALVRSREANDFRAEAQIGKGLGDLSMELREYRDALEYYGGSLTLYNAFNDQAAAAEIGLLIGRAYLRAGQFAEAIDRYERSFGYYQREREAASMARALLGLGEVYAAQGRKTEAVNTFAQGLTTLGTGGDPLLEARLRLQIGLAHAMMKNPNAALDQWRIAVNTLRTKRIGRELEVVLLFQIGTVYFENGRWGDARRYFADGASIARTNGDRVAELYNLLAIALCDERAGDSGKNAEQISQTYADLAERFQQAGHRTGEAFAKVQAANVLRKARQPEAAREFFQKALDIEESILGEYVHSEHHAPLIERLGIERERPLWYLAAAELDVVLKQEQRAMFVMERSASRRFFDELRRTHVTPRHPQLQADVQLARDRLRQIQILEIEFSRLLASARRAVSDEQLAALHAEIAGLKRDVESSGRRIAASHPNFEPLVRIGEPDLAELQSLIPQGAVVVRFVPGDEQLSILALSRTALHVRSSRIGRDALVGAVREYLVLLQDPNVYAGVGGAASVPAMTRFEGLSTQLYEYFFRPIEDLFDRNLLIIPGPMFEGFPFHATERQDAQGNVNYLIEVTSVDYLPSLSSLKYKTASTSRIRDVVALGNPTGRNWSIDYELRDIRSFFREATIMIGLEASWERLNAVRGDVLQLATEFVPLQPEGSLGTIRLATGTVPGEVEDVSFSRLAEAPVYPVVLLSNQDGAAFSLTPTHALFLRIVGTSDVFYNAWYADRKAAKFFSEFFFTHLSNGLAPGDAYRQAILNLMRMRDVGHPRSWGQFFHYGFG